MIPNECPELPNRNLAAGSARNESAREAINVMINPINSNDVSKPAVERVKVVGLVNPAEHPCDSHIFSDD